MVEDVWCFVLVCESEFVQCCESAVVRPTSSMSENECTPPGCEKCGVAFDFFAKGVSVEGDPLHKLCLAF